MGQAHLLKRKGFTLVEIMIVVVLITLIATIAIPSLVRSRHNANETAAIGSMHTLMTAMQSFHTSQTPTTYPADLAALHAEVPQYIDSVLATGSKQGYNFTYALVSSNEFTLTATPISAHLTGTRSFFIDQTGVLRVAPSGTADGSSPPLD